jgi:DNA polymerase-4
MSLRKIIHIDMDAFYASVEQNDDPKLRGKPVIVGGPSRRGVVTAASYEARPFGVHSAMPMAEAQRLCPQAIVVPPRMARYAEVSGIVFEIFGRFTPLVEGLSLDEAFLDVTHSQSLFGDGATIARRIKDAVRRETGLVASAGVASSKFVAKVASDLRKPDALVVVPDGEEAAFLAPLVIERMWGVGKKTAPRLHAEGLRLIGDLARADPMRLEQLLGSWGREVHRLARGEDDRDVVPDVAPNSKVIQNLRQFTPTGVIGPASFWIVGAAIALAGGLGLWALGLQPMGELNCDKCANNPAHSGEGLTHSPAPREICSG